VIIADLAECGTLAGRWSMAQELHMRARIAFALGVVLWWGACGGKTEEQPKKPEVPVTPEAPAPDSKDGAPKPAPPSPAKLKPVLAEVGPDDAVPTAVVIEVAAPIVDQGTVGQVSARSVLEVTPPAPGTLRYTGVSTLTFVPARPLAFGTKYRFELKKLEARGGVVEPPEGEAWARELETPPFAFLGWAPSEINLEKKTVAFELRFSGALLPNRAKPFLAFTVNGKAAANVSFNPSREPNVVVVAVNDPKIALGASLKLAVKKGLPATIDATLASGGAAEYVVSNDKAIAVRHVAVEEGTQGYYLEVVCDDKAADPGYRSFYDRHSGAHASGLSSRCELREEAAARLAFKPAVDRVYLTPGRAGFRVFGDFKRGTYSLTIPGGLTSVDGGVLLAPFTRKISIAARKPQLSFAASGRYLPRSAWRDLGVKHLNVEEANLFVRHVPPENLIFWLSADGSEAADDRTSNLLLKKAVALTGQPDVPATTWLDVGSLLPAETRGVLELRLAGTGAGATARILLTNMSLVAKKVAPAREPWKQEVAVWALGMADNALLDGVEVSLVRRSGKAVARCTTAGARGCTLAAPADDPDTAPPFALVARKGDDLTYIRYEDLKTEVTESSVAGEPYRPESPYRAAVWADRGVYRPGDTAHVAAVLRDRKDVAPAEAVPVEVKLIDPRAKVVKRLALKTNPAGLLTIDHTFPAFADTGHYRVELVVADRPLASHPLQVEEFVPERMKVTAAARRSDVALGDEVAFEVVARYLFGGTAAGSPVEITCRLEHERFEPGENADFTYGVEPSGKPVTLGQEKTTLDDTGGASLVCPAISDLAATGRVTGQVAVLEAGSGRSTVGRGDALVHPEKHYLGLKTQVTKAQAGQAFTVTGLVVDWQGKPAPAAVKEITVEQLHLEAEYGYHYDEEEGESSYDRNVHRVPEGKTKVAVKDGRFTFDVTPGDAGVGYVVRASAGKAVTELVLEGDYAYYHDYEEQGRADQTPRPARATRLALDVPPSVKVGEPLAVKVRAPYRGKVLFSVETDRLVAHEWKDVESGDVSWTFKPAELAPNLYVSAFLVKDPHLESKQAFLPDRAFGVASVRVEPVEFTTVLAIEAPAEVRSSSTLEVKLAAAPTDGPTFATVAVVDEGILSITGFPTPDPLARLFAKRALGVETYETLGWTMLHAPAGTSSRSGGGDEEEEGGGELAESRVQPVKPVALYSGPIEVKDGKAAVRFQLPNYRGQLRVMAFTVGPRRIGRAESKVTVKDPLVVQVTFPRFLTHEDEIQIPVFLTNLSGGKLDVEVAISAETLPVAGMSPPPSAAPPIEMLGKDRGALVLDDGAARTVAFQARARVPVGAATLKVVARARGPKGEIEVFDEASVPFLPAGPRERVVQKVAVEAGDTDVKPLLAGWLPTSERTTFWLTGNPYGESFDHLKHLIRYPYGCVEQTTSSSRPLLYVANLVAEVDPELAEARIEDMVLAGVSRIFSMQTPSGGLGYWPGDTEPVEWGTAYATHFLLDAKEAGYPVPEDRLKQILAWMEDRVAGYEAGGRATRHKRYDEQAEPYMHYVLAKAKRGKKARVASLIAALPKEGLTAERAEDAYLLKAALYLAGDRRHEKDLKSPDVSPVVDDRRNGWSFYSDRRRRGLMLATFFDLFGKDPAGEALAQRVADSLVGRPSYWYTTQELVWGVTGLGKWVEGAGAEFEPGRLLANGAAIAPRPKRGKGRDRTWAVVRASEYDTLTVGVEKKGAGNLWLVVSSEGVREKSEARLGGEGLAVTRTVRNLAGDEVSLEDGSVALGDLLFVELELENPSATVVRNIALVDRLPAGFEIENARLGRGAQVEWVEEDDVWAMDYLNLRDDRLEAFGELGGKARKKIVYAVRAVTAGKFVAPSVEAEAMYDPSVWARDKARTVVVSGPWKEVLL
jgi:uncharacterized protein YfaS (alpha-2-macroglobulin family)